MAELISTFGLTSIVLILLVAIPAIVNFIGWCKKIWSTREKFKQENINKGRELESRKEEKEMRFSTGEARMTTLESDVKDLKKIIAQQQQLIKLLVESDELDIKSWIKAQHEKWMPRKCIDGQTLELLCQRFKIYTKEGGNSWAEKLVEDLMSLPIMPSEPRQED